MGSLSTIQLLVKVLKPFLIMIQQSILTLLKKCFSPISLDQMSRHLSWPRGVTIRSSNKGLNCIFGLQKELFTHNLKTDFVTTGLRNTLINLHLNHRIRPRTPKRFLEATFKNYRMWSQVTWSTRAVSSRWTSTEIAINHLKRTDTSSHRKYQKTQTTMFTTQLLTSRRQLLSRLTPTTSKTSIQNIKKS